MHALAYAAASDAAVAAARVAAARPGATDYIAGGTDMLQLLEEGVRSPEELIDINRLPYAGIGPVPDGGGGLRIGALARLAEIGDDPSVRDRYPVLAAAVLSAASPQVRNMATVGGTLLQRTRCLYFRDAATPCNKREPGSGCPAQDGRNRLNAILGGSPHCIAVQPSDTAVALVVLDAEIRIRAADGTERGVPMEELHRLPGDTPHIETVLGPGDLITAIDLPAAAAERRHASRYLKVRDRASFEWPLASCAVALRLEGDGGVAEARIAAGGVATKPWRLRAVEEVLLNHRGRPDEAAIAAAADRATDGAAPRGDNAYKVPLLRRTVARALTEALADANGDARA